MSIGRKVAKITAVTVLVATAASGIAFNTLNNAIGKLKTNDVSDQLSNRPEKIETTAGSPINIVVIGSDTREGQGTGFGGSSYLGSQRSDTTILVHISGDRQWATAVSIPRDTYIAMPDCKREDGTISKGWSDKFNAAFSRAGAACVITTLEQLTGIRIDHYIQVDFKGFKKVVNAVGGVDVCVTEPVNDIKSHLVLPKGWSTLDGKQAIAFVRARKTLGDGSDISRIRRQQDFLASLVKKIISAQTLLNPVTLVNTLNAVASSITTDLSSLDQMKDLAINLTDLKPSSIRFLTAPNQYEGAPSGDVIFSPKAAELWDALKNDKQWPAPPDSGFDGKLLSKDPADIEFRLLNATTTKGLANEKAALFEALGYRIEKVGNALPNKFTSETAIYASPKKQNAARTLAKALGLSKVMPLPKGSEVQLIVVVGTNWKDPVAVKVRPAIDTGIYAPEEGRAADETSCSPA